jgi:hypothetical protein
MRFATICLSIAIIASAALLSGKLHPATATATSAPAMVFSHFLCYQPNPTGPPPPPPRNVVNLTDQFNAFQTQLGPAVLFCTPVQKKLQPGVRPLPVPPPASHLTCYVLQGPPANKRVMASNQLQRQILTIAQPQLLCVPTNKRVLGSR